MTNRCAIICFEHDHRIAREVVPPCIDLDIDVRVPWSWVEESTIGEVLAGEGATVIEGTFDKIGALGKRHQPICPACKEPLRHTAWSIETQREEGS